MENNCTVVVVVVVCLLTLHLIQCIHAEDHSDEVAALMAFKNKLTDPDQCLSNWDESSVDTPWSGVTKNDDKSVTRIDLQNCQLEGSLAPELGKLKNLNSLVLFNNKLQGSIPKDLGNLTSLVRLDLHGNKLDGSIPEELGNLTNLIFLRLRDNNLSGQVPITLSTLIKLQIVELGNNPYLCGWNADKECL